VNREPAGRARSRFGPARWLKALVTVACLAWIARKVHWSDVAAALADADPAWVLLSLALTPVLILISALKWQLLIRARGDDPGLLTCFRLYTVGYFFNNFLPSNVGGDVARVYLLGRQGGGLAQALASVFLERFTGLTALIALAAIASFAGPPELYQPRVRSAIWLVVLGYLAVLWAVFEPRLARFAHERLRLPLGAKLVRIHDAVAAYRDHPGPLVACLALSVGFYLLAAVNIYVSLRAFGARLDPVAIALATPLILLVSGLPVAIGGLGLQEGTFVVALGVYGVPAAVALAGALLIRVKGILVGAAGLAWLSLGGHETGWSAWGRMAAPGGENGP
jgi:uncharacterized protein (TIRG00374 family)